MNAGPTRTASPTPAQSEGGEVAPNEPLALAKVKPRKPRLVRRTYETYTSRMLDEGRTASPAGGLQPEQAAAGSISVEEDASGVVSDPTRKISAEAPSRGLSEKQTHLLTLYGETSLAATRATISGDMDEAKRLKKMALLHSRRLDLDLVLEAAAGMPFTEELAKRLRATNKLVYESEFEIYGKRQSPIHPLVTKAKTQKSTEIRHRHRQLAG